MDSREDVIEMEEDEDSGTGSVEFDERFAAAAAAAQRTDKVCMVTLVVLHFCFILVYSGASLMLFLPFGAFWMSIPSMVLLIAQMIAFFDQNLS